jgi:hypothetical protein
VAYANRSRWLARTVKRWRKGDQLLRWTAATIVEEVKRPRRIKDFQGILLLNERLNPSRIQQRQFRSAELA